MHLLHTILRLGLIAGLADREAFTEKLAALLEKYQADPEHADKISRVLTSFLENVKDQLSLEQAMDKILRKDNASKEDVAELKKMLEELTRELQTLKQDKGHV